MTQLDDEDDMSPEDEVIGMVIPDGFRLEDSRPAALDNSSVKPGVLDRLNMGWFGGLITRKRWPDHPQESGAHERIVRLPCAS